MGDLVNDLQRAGTKVTKATIRNTLRQQGLKSCSARRVPLLKPVHVRARLKFAREHLDDPEEDWENVIRHFLVTSQLLCRRPRYRVWRPQPGNITLRLSLMENTCRNVNHCWNGISERARAHLMDKSYAFPQLCPVEVQLGDNLLAFTDPMLEQYGINLVNVSKEEFDSCFTEQKQHLFAGYINGSLQVASKWLSPGVHYFAGTHEGSRHLCQLGLRFSVLVKEQLCQNSPRRHLCSGKGVCRAQTGQFAYGCQCLKPYSEPYCDAVDMCSGGPCQNGANCLSSHAAHPSQASYQCLCPSVFTGVNCSEILGQNNCIRRCRNGICLQVSPNSFHCECFDGFTGKSSISFSMPEPLTLQEIQCQNSTHVAGSKWHWYVPRCLRVRASTSSKVRNHHEVGGDWSWRNLRLSRDGERKRSSGEQLA
ncbi:protein eyes shut-like isoform X3 [Silurus asotus]|uniref:Protein eyes shut-like isoform X3 n=1 Tax=Silurus asotus TaxID=30991 RepID=A0AAD5FBK5_SILAS|nr:protein eyes shut-like isoform X3 [Silurus asotus]